MLNKQELAAFNKSLNGKEYDRLPIVFKALSDESRCKIARLLISKGSRRLSVTDIAQVVGQSQSSASQHLKILEITDIVTKEKDGRHHYFHINDDDPIVRALVKAVLVKEI